MQKNSEQYLETSIMTASKEDLIVKIFDVLVLSAQQALERLSTRPADIEGIHTALLRAQRACCLLMGSLNMEIGGELAENLFRVYEFWHHELVMANMQKDATRVERILPDFRDYRDTWQKAVTQFKATRSHAAAAERPAAIPGRGAASFAAFG